MHRLWVAVSLLYVVYAQHDQTKNECQNVEDDVKPDQNDCTRYIYCWQSRTYLFKCHVGFTYDRCQQRCVKIIQPCHEKSVCKCSLNPECVVQKSEVRLSDEEPPPETAGETTVAASEDNSVESSSPLASTPPSDEAVPVGGAQATTAAGYLVKVLFRRDKSELSGIYGAGGGDANSIKSFTMSGGVTVEGEETSTASGAEGESGQPAISEGGTTAATDLETASESQTEASVTGVSGSQAGATSEATPLEEVTGETTGAAEGAATETSAGIAGETGETTAAVSRDTGGEIGELEVTTSGTAVEGSSSSPESASEGPIEGVTGPSAEATATGLSEESSGATEGAVDIEQGTGATENVAVNLVEVTTAATAEGGGGQTTASSAESSGSAGEEGTGATAAAGEATGGSQTGENTSESNAATGVSEQHDTTVASAAGATNGATNESEEPGTDRQYNQAASGSPDLEPTTVAIIVGDGSSPSDEGVSETDTPQSTGQGVTEIEATIVAITASLPEQTEAAAEEEATDATATPATESGSTGNEVETGESDEGGTEEVTTELSNESGPRVTPEESRDESKATETVSPLVEESSTTTELPTSSSVTLEVTGGPLDVQEQSSIIEAAQSKPTKLPTDCACESKDDDDDAVENVRAYCAQLTCRNGGKYFTISSGHCGCVCSTPYRGAECQHLTDESQCHCANGGKCMPMRVDDSDFDAFSCDCPLGFLGSVCQYSVADVINNNSSSKTNTVATTTIDLARYALCDQQDYCTNGGLCLLDVVSKQQRCYCSPGFGGPTCTTVLS